MKKSKILASLVALFMLFSLFNLALGQITDLPVGEPQQSPPIFSGAASFRDALIRVLGAALRILTWVAGTLAVIFIAWGGINVIIQNKIDEGKQRLIYGAIGLVIALLSYAIVSLINIVITTQGGLGG